ncbi:Mettl7b, partial [Symbiodinium natans]
VFWQSAFALSPREAPGSRACADQSIKVGDAAWKGLQLNLTTDEVFRKRDLQNEVAGSMITRLRARDTFDRVMVAVHGLETYQSILDGVDPPRLLAARREMLSLLPSGSATVLEVGIGVETWASNLPLYPATVSLVGLDPEVSSSTVWPKKPRGMDFRAVRGWAEALPFPDNSFDAVVASLVLCSVRDPDTALREIARVLKPGGRYLFLEHIRAPTGSALRWQQEVLHPLHAFCCKGCHLTRQQDRSILSAHAEQLFTSVPVLKHYLCHGDWPCTTQIVGYAVA